MIMITLTTVLERTNDQIDAAVGDELVMLDLDKGTYFVLDDVAAAIWRKLETPVSGSQVCADLQAEYDVPREQCEADVLAFLQKLDARGMVRIVA
jgi:Coenzyme PQQ synthesis protein D (PqqD)